jgi:hypothetical protein
MAVQFGFSKTQEARFPRHDLGAEQTGMNYLRPSPTATARREEICVVSRAQGA